MSLVSTAEAFPGAVSLMGNLTTGKTALWIFTPEFMVAKLATVEAHKGIGDVLLDVVCHIIQFDLAGV